MIKQTQIASRTTSSQIIIPSHLLSAIEDRAGEFATDVRTTWAETSQPLTAEGGDAWLAFSSRVDELSGRLQAIAVSHMNWLLTVGAQEASGIQDNPAMWAHGIVWGWVLNALQAAPLFHGRTEEMTLSGAMPDPLHRWVRVVCDGWQDVEVQLPNPTEDDVRGKLQKLRNWRAPALVCGSLVADDGVEISSRISPDGTQVFLERFRAHFLQRLRDALNRQFHASCKQLAEQGWKPVASATAENAKSVTFLSEFDQVAGKLMADARSMRQKNNRLPESAIIDVLRAIDARGFKPKDELEGRAADTVKDWNSKHSTASDKLLQTFERAYINGAAIHCEGGTIRRAVLKRLSRAEEKYRTAIKLSAS